MVHTFWAPRAHNTLISCTNYTGDLLHDHIDPPYVIGTPGAPTLSKKPPHELTPPPQKDEHRTPVVMTADSTR